MTPKAEGSICFEFGQFRLDVSERTLWRSEVPLILPAKVFETLHLLVQRAGHLVRREELLERLWPNTFVADGALSQNIWLLRKALAHGEGEDFIETRPRIGYRFTAKVSRVDDESQTSSSRRDADYRLVSSEGSFPLKEGENILGRDPDADLTIDGPTVSRHHARIVVSGASAILEDLGSKNGTFVRGVRVKEPRRLVNADEVGFGSVRFVFQHRNLGGKTRTASRR